MKVELTLIRRDLFDFIRFSIDFSNMSPIGLNMRTEMGL